MRVNFKRSLNIWLEYFCGHKKTRVTIHTSPTRTSPMETVVLVSLKCLSHFLSMPCTKCSMAAQLGGNGEWGMEESDVLLSI